jgi:hypothetical protein
LIQTWEKNHPGVRYVAFIRFSNFAEEAGMTPAKAKTTPNSLFSLLYIDPFSGLDPTAQAIEQTRYFAERAMYYGERIPMLLSWQAELLTYQLIAMPESQQMLADINRISKASSDFGTLAQKLPQVIAEQREAAINQVFTELEKSQKQMNATMLNLRETLQAGDKMAASVNTTIKSLDTFVANCSSTNGASSPPATNSPPFNINDYGKTASDIGAAADRLNTLLLTADKSSAQLVSLTGQESKQAVDYAYRKLMLLIIITIISVVVAALGYRWLARRFFGKN